MHRRKFMTTVGGVVAAGIGSFGGRILTADAAQPAMPSTECRATIRQGEGPYLMPDSPLRSDIREDRPGVPIRLKLRVVDDFWCKPIEGAAIDIWHSDALGQYCAVLNELFDLNTLRLSGESNDMRGTTFLRGHQVTDAKGQVEFTTIYPGWYSGRLSHIHIKTIVAGLSWTSHNTQLYLPSEVENSVYATEPYAQRGNNPLGVDRDLVVRGDTQSFNQLTLPLVKDGEGLLGEFELAMSF